MRPEKVEDAPGLVVDVDEGWMQVVGTEGRDGSGEASSKRRVEESGEPNVARGLPVIVVRAARARLARQRAGPGGEGPTRPPTTGLFHVQPRGQLLPERRAFN